MTVRSRATRGSLATAGGLWLTFIKRRPTTWVALSCLAAAIGCALVETTFATPQFSGGYAPISARAAIALLLGLIFGCAPGSLDQVAEWRSARRVNLAGIVIIASFATIIACALALEPPHGGDTDLSAARNFLGAVGIGSLVSRYAGAPIVYAVACGYVGMCFFAGATVAGDVREWAVVLSPVRPWHLWVCGGLALFSLMLPSRR